MQSICAYDHAYIGRSDFCNLFTEEEWMGFEQTLDIEYVRTSTAQLHADLSH